MQETWKWCRHCQANVVASRPTPNHILHLLLTVVTAGLWVIIWIGRSIRIGGWRCTQCGQAIGLGVVTRVAIAAAVVFLIIVALVSTQPQQAGTTTASPVQTAPTRVRPTHQRH